MENKQIKVKKQPKEETRERKEYDSSYSDKIMDLREIKAWFTIH